MLGSYYRNSEQQRARSFVTIPIVIWIIALALFLTFTSGCSTMKVYVLGVDVNEAVKAKDIGMMALGAAASVATHVVGHYAAAELIGADVDQQGVREVITNPGELSNSDKRWVARGGFAAQTVVNTVLTSFESTRKSKFVRGYTIGTMLEVGTYPLRWSNEGDLKYLEDNGGSDTFEWALYTGFSAYNFYRINREEQHSDN